MSLPTPNTRKEQYLNAIATGNAGGLPTPITREEEYLDAIAKGGGGSGDGDMKKSVYDSDLDVAGAGGIKAFVNDAVSGKVDKVEGKGLSTNDYTDEDKAIVDGVTDALAEKADIDDIPDLVSDNLAKGILGNETVLSTDTVPFVSKLMGTGKYQRKKFVGCSFVWNQLVDSNTESVTIASGHKYALYQNGAWSIGASDGTAIAVTGGSDLFTDLTQLFGSTAIADYIYNLETATAGAGVAKLKELGFFTENYYAYDAGSVQSVDIKEYSVVDGFNLWDEQWEIGDYSGRTGEKSTNNHAIRSKNLIPVIPNNDYYIRWTDKYSSGGRFNVAVFFYDVDKKYIRNVSTGIVRDTHFSFTVSADVCYISFYVNDYNDRPITNYYNDICINLSDPARNGQYEPYHKTTYPLTPTELRGVPKIDANNNIYCDGDEYASDGTRTEKYKAPIKVSDISWSRTGYKGGSTVFRADNNFTGEDSGLCSNVFIQGLPESQDHAITYRSLYWDSNGRIAISAADCATVEEFVAAYGDVTILTKKSTPTTETLTPFDYPQSVGSLEEITDYKVEQEDRDVAIPTGHVTEYMGKGGEFTLPTLPTTPSVLAFDGHNFFWKPETA